MALAWQQGHATRLARWSRALAATLALVWAFAPVHAADRALIVGVSLYPMLPGKRLEGPANDVRLMRSSLGRLGFDDTRIVELSEAAGPAAWPTRSNILAALDALAAASAKGDWVIVYFSGHGTQVPQTRATRALRPEVDGLDEVFLPRDASRWDARARRVDGGIVDDEFGAAFDRIRARGARVWAIFDTCHAGDMTRAATRVQDERAPVLRYVPPEDFGVPAAAASAMSMSTRVGRSKAAPTGSASSLVAYFASATDEPAAEELLPDPEVPGTTRRFGVFTYELHRALASWRGDFAVLSKRLLEAYESRPFPTPQFEGDLKLLPAFARPQAAAAGTSGR